MAERKDLCCVGALNNAVDTKCDNVTISNLKDIL